MTITITTDMKARLIRLLADGKTLEYVADDLGCLPDHVRAIARNHGYPDVEKLAWAADIMEGNLTKAATAGKVKPTSTPPAQPMIAPVQRTSDGNTATHIDGLLAGAKMHESAKIRAAAEHVAERVARLRLLIAEDSKKNADKRRRQAEREAARAEVERLSRELAEARAKLRPARKPTAPAAAGDHACTVEGCDRTFPTTQGRALHVRRTHTTS